MGGVGGGWVGGCGVGGCGDVGWVEVGGERVASLIRGAQPLFGAESQTSLTKTWLAPDHPKITPPPHPPTHPNRSPHTQPSNQATNQAINQPTNQPSAHLPLLLLQVPVVDLPQPPAEHDGLQPLPALPIGHALAERAAVAGDERLPEFVAVV